MISPMAFLFNDNEIWSPKQFPPNRQRMLGAILALAVWKEAGGESHQTQHLFLWLFLEGVTRLHEQLLT